VRPDLSLRLLECLHAGDYDGAMALWELVRPFEELRARGNNANNVPAVKEALAQLGLCRAAVRPPINELSEDERAEVREMLAVWERSSPPSSPTRSDQQ
jgi:4-hydroxy-tetrahydrodipicolinate synthase